MSEPTTACGFCEQGVIVRDSRYGEISEDCPYCHGTGRSPTPTMESVCTVCGVAK